MYYCIMYYKQTQNQFKRGCKRFGKNSSSYARPTNNDTVSDCRKKN